MDKLSTETVTFFFTDIEGSTRLWEAQPEAMIRALARQAIEGESGIVFKTVGDAFCAAFRSPRHALQAALGAQRALGAEPWPDDTPIRVRMALHTGVAEERDGDYFGPALNRTARLLAVGHGGQTLVSFATQQLLAEALPGGVSLKDLAAHRLKDLSLPEHVFQLAAPDLPDDFPPLRSLEVRPNNLPVQLTSFVGREAELGEIQRLLGTTRLLTLTGAGGTGKTRLALQLAAELAEDFRDGVWFVDLAPIVQPDLVAHTVARVLGLREEPGRTIGQTLVAYLQPRELLLVLDNCEHLVEVCAALAHELLTTCPALVVLATSRETPHVSGEVVWPVATLSVPAKTVSAAANGDAPARVAETEAGEYSWSVPCPHSPASG